MKILLDECVPKAIKRSFLAGGHECSTVPEAGFAGRTNGELLTLAESIFEVFITVDKGIRFQQNLGGSKIAVVLIRAKSSRVADVLARVPACLTALSSIKPGQMIEIGS